MIQITNTWPREIVEVRLRRKSKPIMFIMLRYPSWCPDLRTEGFPGTTVTRRYFDDPVQCYYSNNCDTSVPPEAYKGPFYPGRIVIEVHEGAVIPYNMTTNIISDQPLMASKAFIPVSISTWAPSGSVTKNSEDQSSAFLSILARPYNWYDRIKDYRKLMLLSGYKTNDTTFAGTHFDDRRLWLRKTDEGSYGRLTYRNKYLEMFYSVIIKGPSPWVLYNQPNDMPMIILNYYEGGYIAFVFEQRD